MLALTFGWWCLICTVGYLLVLAVFLWGWARLHQGGRDD